MNSDVFTYFTNIDYEDFFLHFKDMPTQAFISLKRLLWIRYRVILFNATDLIEKLIAEKKKVIRFPLNGTWIDSGNPQEYQKANELVKHMGM